MYYNLRELYDLLRSKKFLSCGTRGIVLINDDNTLIKVLKELSSYINSFDDFKNSFLGLKVKGEYFLLLWCGNFFFIHISFCLIRELYFSFY